MSEYDLRLLILELDDLAKRLQDNYNDNIPFEQCEEDRLAVIDAIEIIEKIRQGV